MLYAKYALVMHVILDMNQKLLETDNKVFLPNIFSVS